jgi:hypothetical protein
MAAYGIFIRESTQDQAELDVYCQSAGKTSQPSAGENQPF